MTWLQDLPIRKKLTWVILHTSSLVLILACTALAIYEVYDFRRAVVRDTAVLADIIGKNTRAALAFEDDKAAEDVLHALQSEPHVTAAALFDRHGKLFAVYSRIDSAEIIPTRPEADGRRFTFRTLDVYRPVTLQEKRIGTIYIKMDMDRIHSRLWMFAGIIVLVLFGAILVTLALSSWLQAPISRPILDLAATAQRIAERKDYTLRAVKQGKNEIGVLTDAFNDVLTGIQERERALHAEIIERELAENRVKAQLSRLAQLHQITRATGERQDLKSIFQVVVRSLEDHLPVDFGCMCLYDEDAHTLTVASIGSAHPDLIASLAITEDALLPVDENGLSRCLRGELVYEPDLTNIAFSFPQRLARAGLQSLVAAPLLVENTVFGVLLAARRQANAFSSGECEFLKQLSEHVALAAHQAHLYGALQQAYDDLRQSQQAILQQERLRALGQMASGIAHDINNAISPVTLYTESLLETEPNLSDRARDYLSTIQRAMEDVAQTVSRMREFYRQREAQLSLFPLHLNRVITQVVNLTRVRWSDMPLQNGVVIEMHSELTENLPAILGVEGEIREALTNLIFNAVDALPEGGAITVRTRLDRDQVVVEVSDSGVGMDEDTLRRCLEPFFTTKGERGTGLGLAMVYGTIQRHNAQIKIDSARGRGTTVRLLFPVPTSLPIQEVVITPAPTLEHLRLLVIDDDPLIIKSLDDILTTDGHTVVAVTGGQAGIDAFVAAQNVNTPFDLVITDLGMPYVDGRKVAAAIKAASAHTPVVLLTGWGERMAAEGDIPPHVDRVLSKPPKLTELRAAFHQLLAPHPAP